MKFCAKCNTEKDESEFGKNKGRPDGLTPSCKECNREYVRQKRQVSIQEAVGHIIQPEVVTDTIPVNEHVEEATEQEPEEEEVDEEALELKRDKLRQKIRMYLDNFPKLKQTVSELDKIDKDPDYFDTLDIADLERLLIKVKAKVSSKNLNFLLEVGFYQCMVGPLETVCTNYTPLKVQGLEKALKQNEAVEDCLKEIAIKYSDYVEKAVEPEYRLMGLVAFTVMSMHTINTKKELTSKMKQQEVSASQVKMFNSI